MRVKVPLVITFVGGTFMLMQFFVPHALSVTMNQEVLKWGRIVSAFALILGIGSLLKTHVDRIRIKGRDWGYSIITLIGLVVMSIVGLRWGVDPGSMFDWLFMNVQVPMDATMFSLLAFFIASAAYRTFRARTPEATLLLLTAVVCMIGNVPIGSLLADVTGGAIDTPKWLNALLEYPNLAQKRGIMLGVALGVIATSLRIIIGMERSHLAGD